MEDFVTEFMEEAIRLSLEKMQQKEGGPFGAVIVRNGEIIARGWNRVSSTNDPTAHAEIVAIKEACLKIGDFWLGGCDLYVNCEPCPMCLGAIYWSGIKRVFFAATRKDAAGAGFADNYIYEELFKPVADRNMVMTQMMRDSALPVFEIWDKMEDKIEY
ncbi:MAG: nucleoside deaminase [Proteobacteria bacterium]|nr:nucleoside deaminase [Pseudomonadota bacterium]MBU1716458.1 nucleoside deaminase [Pseudomonadota bacterium]